jgi:hypothetical protein
LRISVAQKLQLAKPTSWTLKTDTIPLLRRDKMRPLAIWWDPSAVRQIDEMEAPVALSVFAGYNGLIESY